MWLLSAERLLDQTRQHLGRIEILLGDTARSFRVAGIVAFDLADPSDGLVHAREGEDAFPHRDHVPEAGVLHDDGPAGGEITRRPAAEPAGLASDVAVLGHTPLGLRRHDVITIVVQALTRVES